MAIFVTLTLLCLLGSVTLFAIRFRRYRRWTACSGVVREVISQFDSDGNAWSFVAEFQDAGGNTHQVTRGYYSRAMSYRVGDRVDIIYDPQDPATARITGLIALYGGAVLLFVLALFFALFVYGSATQK